MLYKDFHQQQGIDYNDTFNIWVETNEASSDPAPVIIG